MKIAFFVHCFFPGHFYGTETYTLDLALNLMALGHQVVVVTARFSGEPLQSALVERYEYAGVPVVSIDKNRIPHRRVRETYYQPEIAPLLRDIVRELKPDIVHVTHLINHTATLLEVLADESIPTVATFTDFFGFCFNNRLEAVNGGLCGGPNPRASNCLACYLKAAAHTRPNGLQADVVRHGLGATIVACSLDILQRLPGRRTGATAELVQDIAQRPQVLRSLYRHYRAAIAPTAFLRTAYERNGIQGRIVEIRFGVDIPRDPKPKRERGSPLVLGFIGQIAPHKGTDLLLDAAARGLGRKGYEIHIFGPMDEQAPYCAALRTKAADLPARFLGTFPPERMRQVMDGIDFLVIPSRWYENSPLVLLYALASATPVIVSDVDGLTEFVRDGENGFVFPRGSSVGLARVLQRIVAHHPDLTGAMVEGVSYATTTRAMTEQTLALYGEVC